MSSNIFFVQLGAISLSDSYRVFQTKQYLWAIFFWSFLWRWMGIDHLLIYLMKTNSLMLVSLSLCRYNMYNCIHIYWSTVQLTSSFFFLKKKRKLALLTYYSMIMPAYFCFCFSNILYTVLRPAQEKGINRSVCHSQLLSSAATTCLATSSSDLELSPRDNFSPVTNFLRTRFPNFPLLFFSSILTNFLQKW